MFRKVGDPMELTRLNQQPVSVASSVAKPQIQERFNARIETGEQVLTDLKAMIDTFYYGKSKDSRGTEIKDL